MIGTYAVYLAGLKVWLPLPPPPPPTFPLAGLLIAGPGPNDKVH